MAKIYNFNKSKNDEDKLAESFEYILTMPDDMFKAVYPQLKEELVKSIKSGEFDKETFQEGITDYDKQQAIQGFKDLRKMLEEEDVIFEKLDFIDTICSCLEDVFLKINDRDSVIVAVEFCHENAKEPTYSNPDDAGCDVYAVEECDIAPGATTIIRTGLKVAVPAGWMLSVRPRSGMSAKTGIRVANAPGTIDTGYRDEVGIILHNTSNDTYTVKAGDRIAQFVIEPAPMIKFKKVESVADIGENRGGGFGHSGK